MKFFAPLLLAAALNVPVAANDALDHYKGSDMPVMGREILRGPDGLFYRKTREGNDGLYRLVPRNDEERRELGEVRSRGDHGRSLQELAVVSPTEAGATFSGATAFSVSGVSDDMEDPKFVFESTDMSYTVLADDIVNGTATEEIGGFKTGDYTWHFEATLNGDKVTVDGLDFSYGPPVETEAPRTIVRTSGSTVVTEGPWEGGGVIQGATGRIYYSSFDVDYACTGTVVKDNKSGRSLILTAAHCVWDDIDENFGSNVIFIPNRDSVTIPEGETGEDIHRVCTEDVCGCWTLSGGVVHDLWKETPWPQRLAYDYGFYVVDDVGSHQGQVCGSEALDEAVEELEFTVGVDVEGMIGHAFGYSLDFNPDFRYCGNEVLGTNQPTPGTDTAWLDSCMLSGGASGGPWLVDFESGTGTGKVFSVNSWSFSAGGGNGAPFVDESEARCLVNAARAVDIPTLEAEDDGAEGIFVNCYDRPCIPAEQAGEVEVRKLRGGRQDERVLCEV